MVARIFDILRNAYRLITVVGWQGQRIYVKALLTQGAACGSVGCVRLARRGQPDAQWPPRDQQGARAKASRAVQVVGGGVYLNLARLRMHPRLTVRAPQQAVGFLIAHHAMLHWVPRE